MMKKYRCKKCNEEKGYESFIKNKKSTLGIVYTCHECAKNQRKTYYEGDKERILAQQKKRYQENIDSIRKKQRDYLRTERGRILAIISNINKRCLNPTNKRFARYGGRGIKNFLTYDDILSLWNRDSASSMVKPSIDRIDVNGNYEINNCHFIEMRENSRKDLVKKVNQLDKNGVLIKTWDAIVDAGKGGFEHSNIISCCKGRRKSHKGFIWKYE
jgi:hypothetical protein